MDSTDFHYNRHGTAASELLEHVPVLSDADQYPLLDDFVEDDPVRVHNDVAKGHVRQLFPELRKLPGRQLPRAVMASPVMTSAIPARRGLPGFSCSRKIPASTPIGRLIWRNA